MLQVGGGIGLCLRQDAAVPAQERGAHFSNELLLRIGVTAEGLDVHESFAVQPLDVACAVASFVEPD